MPGHFETVVFHPVPADPDAQAKPAIREQVNIRGLFGEQGSLSLRQDDHARRQSEVLGNTGEVSVGDQRLVERIVLFIRAGQLRFSAFMNGAEDMIVDHNMVVTEVFGRLGKRLDRPRIAAKFDLRINHTSFHRPLLFHAVRFWAKYRAFTSGPEGAARTPAHNFGRDTVADYPAR